MSQHLTAQETRELIAEAVRPLASELAVQSKRIDILERQLAVERARSHNSRARLNQPLVPVPTANGSAPALFPRDAEHLFSGSDPRWASCENVVAAIRQYEPGYEPAGGEGPDLQRLLVRFGGVIGLSAHQVDTALATGAARRAGG